MTHIFTKQRDARYRKIAISGGIICFADWAGGDCFYQSASRIYMLSSSLHPPTKHLIWLLMKCSRRISQSLSLRAAARPGVISHWGRRRQFTFREISTHRTQIKHDVLNLFCSARRSIGPSKYVTKLGLAEAGLGQMSFCCLYIGIIQFTMSSASRRPHQWGGKSKRKRKCVHVLKRVSNWAATCVTR